ncbi:MAG TPA: Wzz/FepE/Etk N-terminal domain-containing protein [Steroidobacteraceae bacterium]|jgi:uncharacterized protein involved in exopolysaccharide biosynthesis
MSLRDVLRFCWASRWLVSAFVAVTTVGAVVLVLVWPSQYQATVLLLPVTGQSAPSGLGALGEAVSSLGGLASLAGLNLNGSSAKAEAIATLQSEALTERYIRENNLLPVLYSKRWDATRKAWNTTDPEKIPTLWKANQYFEKDLRKLVENPKNGLVTLTITWKDPRLAAQWANDLVRLTNDYQREKAIEESERNIAYLNDQAAKNNVVEVRKSIYTLMESEIKKGMLARGSKEYALKVIDPATVPEKRSYPRPVMWTVGGMVLGLILGLFAAALRRALSAPEAGEAASPPRT